MWISEKNTASRADSILKYKIKERLPLTRFRREQFLQSGHLIKNNESLLLYVIKNLDVKGYM